MHRLGKYFLSQSLPEAATKHHRRRLVRRRSSPVPLLEAGTGAQGQGPAGSAASSFGVTGGRPLCVLTWWEG